MDTIARLDDDNTEILNLFNLYIYRRYVKRDRYLKLVPYLKKLCKTMVSFCKRIQNVDDIHEPLVEIYKFTASLYTKIQKQEEITNEIHQIVILYRNLKRDINPIKNRNIHFVFNEPGSEYIPFPFSDLNLYLVWCNINQSDKEYLLQQLEELYNASQMIFHLSIAPFDKELLCEDVLHFLDVVKRYRPDFNQIIDFVKEYIQELSDKFYSYYISYLLTNNYLLTVETMMDDMVLWLKKNRPRNNFDYKVQSALLLTSLIRGELTDDLQNSLLDCLPEMEREIYQKYSNQVITFDIIDKEKEK